MAADAQIAPNTGPGSQPNRPGHKVPSGCVQLPAALVVPTTAKTSEECSMWTRNGDLGWLDFDFPGREFERLFRSLDDIRRDVDRLRGGREPNAALARSLRPHYGPSVSLDDVGQQLVFRAELPGLGEENIDISVNAQTLTIRGERSAEVPEGYSVHRKERRSVRFERSYQLPCKVDPDKCEASLRHGVLTLSLPKAPEARPKQITVKAN
jgi:HSP20 family protein